jgi:hypothetical protein
LQSQGSVVCRVRTYGAADASGGIKPIDPSLATDD